MRSRIPVVFVAAAVAAGIAVEPAVASAQDRPTVYVFLNTDVKSAVLEKALQAKLPDLSVIVFGRFRDFEEALTTRPPDAVLAAQPLLVARKLNPVLRGMSEGRDVSSVVLLSAGPPLEGSLANRTIGVVDYLGRKGTQELVASLLQ